MKKIIYSMTSIAVLVILIFVWNVFFPIKSVKSARLQNVNFLAKEMLIKYEKIEAQLSKIPCGEELQFSQIKDPWGRFLVVTVKDNVDVRVISLGESIDDNEDDIVLVRQYYPNIEAYIIRDVEKQPVNMSEELISKGDLIHSECICFD